MQISSSDNNLTDLADYIQKRVDSGSLNKVPGIKEKIEQLASGNFLYAEKLLDSLSDTDPLSLTPEDLDALPSSLGGLYDKMFTKRFSDLDIYENEIVPLATCLAATRGPVPEDLLIAASGLNPRTAARGLRSLSQFLTKTDAGLRFFHLSLIQWLTEDPVGNSYSVYLKEGQEMLADACMQEIHSGKEELSDYVVFNTPYYLMDLERLDDLEKFLRDSRCINQICDYDDEAMLALLALVERTTPLTVRKVYVPILTSSSEYGLSVLENIAGILYSIGYLDESFELWNYIENFCRKDNDLERLQRSLGKLGDIFAVRLDPDLPFILYNEQESICRELGLKADLQRCLGKQGKIAEAQGALESAMELSRESESICRKLGLKADLQSCLGTQGDVLYSRFDHDGAMALYKDQEVICRELGLKADLQSCLGNQGFVLYTRGDLDGAMALYKDREVICRELGLKADLQCCLGNQGNVLCARGDLDGAMELFKEQERICRELDLNKSLHWCIKNQESVHRVRGE